MNKRITITSFLLVVLLSSVSAQFKVVEKSAKKAPVWYQKMVEDYLIVSAHRLWRLLRLLVCRKLRSK